MKIGTLILTWLARDLIDQAYQAGANTAGVAKLERINAQLQVHMHTFVGKPVIAVTGQYDDLRVGFVQAVNLDQSTGVPYPVVMDYVSLQTQVVFGRLYPWSDELLATLMKLTAQQRWAILNSADSISRLAVNLKHTPNDTPEKTYDEITAILQRNGFYALVQPPTA
jgi:hypothetical protein